MSEPKETKIAMEGEIQTNEPQDNKPGIEGLSRRAFLGVGSAGLASAALASLAVNAQERADTDQTFLRRPITDTSSRYGTPSI